MTDFGGKLRQARERRGVSLRQIAASTKISIAALEALERNDVARLPGGIFSRAFVRAYAVEVGLDPDQTVREFLDRFHAGAGGAEAPDESEDAGASDERQRTTGVLLKIIVAGFVAAALILYLAWRQSAGSARLPAGQRQVEFVPTRGATLQVPWIPASDRL
jgi:cytoskeleton protein RodZ